MATIEDRAIILVMLRNNGVYYGDPRAKAIFLYRNLPAEKWTHAICHSQEAIMDLEASPYVGANLVLWDEDDGLSEQGQKYIDGADPESLFTEMAGSEATVVVAEDARTAAVDAAERTQEAIEDQAESDNPPMEG